MVLEIMGLLLFTGGTFLSIAMIDVYLPKEEKNN